MSRVDWINWYNLTGDPFSTHPLRNEWEFDDLLIITESMKLHLLPFINHFDNQKPTIQLLIGSQGIGKSTLLHYVLNKLELLYSVIPIYIGILPYKIRNSPDSVFAVSNEVLYTSIRRFLDHCYEKRRNLVETNRRVFQKWLIFMGLEYIPEIGIVTEKQVDRSFDHLNSTFLEILNFAQKKGIGVVLAIDNLDKIDEKIALEYLKVSTSQPLFEAISSYGVHVLIAANKEWAELFSKHREYSFLQNKMPLNELTLPEAYDLLCKRFQDKFNFNNNVPFDFAFSRNLTSVICEKKNGITRDTLSYSREILKLGFQIRKKHLDVADLSREKLPTISSLYFDLSKEFRFKETLDKLSSIRSKFSDEHSLRIIHHSLSNVYSGQKTKSLDFQTLKLLLNHKILTLGETKDQRTEGLYPDIADLFRQIEQSGCTISEFLEWFFSAEEERFIKVTASPRTIESGFREILNNFDPTMYDKTEVVISTGPNPAEKRRSDIAWWIRKGLEKDLTNYLELIQADKETIDNYSFIDSLNRILWWFVDSLVKRFILETDKPIDANFKTWAFRLKGLEEIQDHYKTRINSIWKLKSFINLHYALRNDAQVRENEIETFYGYFMDIIEELADFWIEKIDAGEKIHVEPPKISVGATTEIERQSVVHKQERLVNHLYTLIEKFQDNFSFLDDALLNSNDAKPDLKTEIWKLLRFMNQIEAIDDLVQSFEAKENEEFDDAFSKATRALDTYCINLAKRRDGFKKKNKLMLKDVLLKLFEKDGKLSQFVARYSKYSEKSPMEDFKTKFYLIAENEVTEKKKLLYPEACESYIQSFALALLIRNFIHHKPLPKKKPISTNLLYFGINSIYVSILQLALISFTMNRFFSERLSIVVESIDKESRLIRLSTGEESKLDKASVEEFVKRYKSEDFFFWHFLQRPLIESSTFLECVAVLLFLKAHNWLKAEQKHLFLRCQWTDIPPFRQEKL